MQPTFQGSVLHTFSELSHPQNIRYAKLCLGIIKHHSFKTVESGFTASYISLHDTRCRWQHKLQSSLLCSDLDSGGPGFCPRIQRLKRESRLGHLRVNCSDNLLYRCSKWFSNSDKYYYNEVILGEGKHRRIAISE